jgi:hypothetical protein
LSLHNALENKSIAIAVNRSAGAAR